MAGSVRKDGDSATGSRVGQEAEMRQTRLDTAGRAEVQLTEEEKAVLIECRRNSTARGLAATAGSILLLRALIASGRAPLHLRRWSSIYYTSVGAVSFLTGLRSYREACLNKIMSLDHSVLADQLRQHQRKKQGWSDEDPLPNMLGGSPQPLTSPPPLSKPSIAPRNIQFSSGSDSSEEQPDAFGPVAVTPPPLTSDYDSSSKIRGRTFDEIRDENRRRQQGRHYPHSRVGGVRGEDAGSKPVHVRRNKYGDIISEE